MFSEGSETEQDGDSYACLEYIKDMGESLYLLFLIISFLASLIGSICGIGGGVIIKPVLDATGMMDVSAISFLSGCTVLSMTAYCVIKSKCSKTCVIDVRTSTILAVGAAIGGIIGKNIFQMVWEMFTNHHMVGLIQAICLVIITVATLIYTVCQGSIRTKRIRNVFLTAVIGMLLGVMSSFLGIGGGPINLVVLFYFFSMDIKTAAQNSLYIILFSQVMSLLTTLITKTVPDVSLLILGIMVGGGILGGMIGTRVNGHIKPRYVSQLFVYLMIVIIMINIYNILQFIQAVSL